MRAVIKRPEKIVPLCVAALFFLTMYLAYTPYGMRVICYPLYREIKKKDFVLRNGGFNTANSPNFTIYYQGPSAGSVSMIDEDAEKDLAEIMDDYNYHMEGKINIVVYPEYDMMANRIGLGMGSTAMGVYYEGIISILEPTKWIQRGKDVKETFKKDGPVAHELTHYILDYISGGNIPVWFTEGAALYEEYRVNGVQWGEGVNMDSLYSMKDLEGNFYGLDEVKAYRESFIIVKYIGDNYGMGGITGIAKELGKGRSFDQAAKKVLNMSKDQLYKKSLS